MDILRTCCTYNLIMIYGPRVDTVGSLENREVLTVEVKKPERCSICIIRTLNLLLVARSSQSWLPGKYICTRLVLYYVACQ